MRGLIFMEVIIGDKVGSGLRLCCQPASIYTVSQTVTEMGLWKTAVLTSQLMT